MPCKKKPCLFSKTKVIAFALCTFLFLETLANDNTSNKVFDVRSYGAQGDGKAYDGDAIQKAIDECNKNGGGRVLLDNGTFYSGGIRLKDNVELHISASAVLLAWPDVKKYILDNEFRFKEGILAFIYSFQAKNFSITGPGKIDGQGTLFKVDKYSERPQLILFRACTDVRVQDIFITNSGMFNLWVIQCERLRIEGIRMESLQTPNNDGIDIDGCRDVFISNCNLNTLDDCLAFKNSDINIPSKDIVVTNCILSSRCAAIRFGPDASSDIENVTISNCIIRNTGLNGIKIQEPLGATMRNLLFSNIVMENTKGPISIRLSGWDMGPYNGMWVSFSDTLWPKGRLQNIQFDNIRATVPKMIQVTPDLEKVPAGWLNLTTLNNGIHITGTSQTRPRDITFSNIDITFAGGGTAAQAARRNVPDLDQDYPEMYMFGELPAYGLYMHHVSGVTLNNVRFTLDSADLRPAIVADDVDDLELYGFKAEGNIKGEAVIRLENSRNVLVYGSRPLNQVGSFLRVEGARSSNILVDGTVTNLLKKIFNQSADVKPGTVTVK